MGTIENFEALLARGQDSDMLRLGLGQAYYKAGAFDKAERHLLAAVEHNPTYSAAWKLLGRARVEAGNMDGALGAFDKGLEAARANGDKQTEKEINVFRKRVLKRLSGDTDRA